MDQAGFARLRARVADANGGFRVGHGAPLGLVLDVELAADGAIVADWTPTAHAEGPPGIVHGGVQAYLADGMAGYATVDAEARRPETTLRMPATTDLRLRFRAPVTMDDVVRLEARVVGHDERNVTTHVLIGQAGRADRTEAHVVYRLLDRPWIKNPYTDTG